MFIMSEVDKHKGDMNYTCKINICMVTSNAGIIAANNRVVQREREDILKNIMGMCVCIYCTFFEFKYFKSGIFTGFSVGVI